MSLLPDIRQAYVAGRRVLIRADLNVPFRNGKVSDTTRISRFAPTARELISRGAHVVVMTHLGRPGGEPNPAYSVQQLAGALAKAAGCEVTFARDCVGSIAAKALAEKGRNHILLLENLRFHKGEEENSSTFARRLAVNGDIYVNDAFSSAHRAHASTHAITREMPAYAGPSLLAEIETLDSLLNFPARPVAAIIGGADISSKIPILLRLVTRMDHLVISGGMANTFLAAQGRDVGRSLYEKDCTETALAIMRIARENLCDIVLPKDFVVAKARDVRAQGVVSASAIPRDLMALDIGPATVAYIEQLLLRCRTLLWNGPLGAFEHAPFKKATFAVARHAARLTQDGHLATIAGGGETAAALTGAGVADNFTYISTAGAAFLEYLEGRTLPGIETLRVSGKLETA